MARNNLGWTYYCPVCGSEVSVIRGGNGELKPVCCEVPMLLRKTINKVYYCPNCCTEIMLIKSCSDNLAPVCCHIPMQEKIPG